jgi:hypothetical protein
MSDPTYDPIPEAVRAAYDAFKLAAEAAGFAVPSTSLHGGFVLEAGDDRAIGCIDHITRYWPTCGGGGLNVIGKSPITVEEWISANPAEGEWLASAKP